MRAEQAVLLEAGSRKGVSVENWLIVSLSLAAAIGSFALFGSGGGDDSHITWWAVDQLRGTGHFHNYNQVSLEQSSSLALVLIAACARLIVPVSTPALGVVLSLIASAGTCWMTARVARHFSARMALPAALLVDRLNLRYREVHWSLAG